MWIAVRNAVWLQTALKTLMVMHRLMRESNISFVEEVGSCVHARFASMQILQWLVCLACQAGFVWSHDLSNNTAQQ